MTDQVRPRNDGHNHWHNATKREVAAFMAMQGLLANPSPNFDEWSANDYSHEAAMHADSMLDELAKRMDSDA